MRKRFFTWLASLALATTVSGELRAQAPVFSNYGVQNLTYDCQPKNFEESTTHKPETYCEGNTLHLLWQENNWGLLSIWYRRSNDLGKTWDSPVEVLPERDSRYDGCTGDCDYKVLTVKDGVVYVVYSPSWSRLDLLRSTDGIHFENTIVAAYESQTCSNVHVEVVGQKVVIAYYHDDATWVACSSDGGKTFTLNKPMIPEGSRVHDMAFDGQHIVLYSSMPYAIYNTEGVVYASYSDDFGRTFSHTLLSPALIDENGKTVYRSWVSEEGDYDHQPQQFMALEGSNCYAIFQARTSEDSDETYVLFAKSDDYGKTWGKPHRIDNDKIRASWRNTKNMLKAKGDNVYVVLQTNQETGQYEVAHTVFHSHDCGATFEAQDCWVESTHLRGHLASYWLTFDPNDPTGNAVWLTNNDYSWIYTNDGFRHVAKATFNDSNCPDRVGFWENLYTQLEIDKNGTRHWFISYRPDGSKRLDVCYRRDAGEPEPTDFNQAFYVKSCQHYERISSRVNIPASSTYHNAEAFTVETWVNVPNTDKDQTLAFHSHDKGQYVNYGWRIYLEHGNYWHGGEGGVRLGASLCNDANDWEYYWPGAQYWPDDSVLVHAGEWHHVALTFDAKQHVAQFYIDGKMWHEREVAGTFKWGWNPVVLGHDDGNDERGAYQLDNFRIWDRALTASEIRASARNNNLTTAPGLKVNMGFDGTLRDLSGYGNDGYGMSDVDFVVADHALGIEAVRADEAVRAVRHDLLGRPMSNDAKGLGIERGSVSVKF